MVLLSNAAGVVLLLSLRSSLAAVDLQTAPNIIIMQPDDLQYYEDWVPPAHMRTKSQHHFPNNSTLPNMNRLRDNGVEMRRAYTASPLCGTSRYSTITSRYASRSSYSRSLNMNIGEAVSTVRIPTTKLQDRSPPGGDGLDCKVGNIAALFQEQGYRTGVVGKWHLLATTNTWSYTDVQETIRACGFDSAEAIYKENLGDWTNDEFHHNMEYVASRAVKFIEDTPSGSTSGIDRQPFFLYANPTVPHIPGVLDALQNYDCTQTPEGNLTITDHVHNVIGMTADYGGDCAAYRQSIIDRAFPSTSDDDLGSIWADDAIGAIIDALERRGELDNTIFVYQQDHGQEAKDTLWEQGARIFQVVHFPNGGFSVVSKANGFDGVVSTIDIGPTIADYAGIDSSSLGWYNMDGRSWKAAIQSGKDWGGDDKCIVSELDKDRAVVCGCDKYIRIFDETDASSGTVNVGIRQIFRLGFAKEMLFDLCAGTGTYMTSPEQNPEESNSFDDRPVRAAQLAAVIDCHLAKTIPANVPDYTECETSPASPASLPTSAPLTNEPTFSPSADDTDIPVLNMIVPAPSVYLGAVASYEFAAEVSDASPIAFVRFEFRIQGDPNGSIDQVDATFDSGLGMYVASFDLSSFEGTMEWRVISRDSFANLLISDWEVFFVGVTAATVASVVRFEVEQLIAADTSLAAKFVRMGFHDCIGGCDGCIDLQNGDNAGLNVPIDALEPIVSLYENAELNRADIWAIATLASADVSLPVNARGRFPLTHIGRKNCEDRSDSCPNVCDARNGPSREMPSPDLTTHEILDFFNIEFGFDTQETVALMGAHTLGTMSRSNSGFGNGGWVPNQVLLNNAYYASLVGGTSASASEAELLDAPNWAVATVDNSAIGTPDRTQWVRTVPGGGPQMFMTNTDIALVRNLNDGTNPDYLNEISGVTTGDVSCRFKCTGNNCNNNLLPPVCPAAQQTLQLMAVYKNDNNKWVDDFEAVMAKMMIAGYTATVCPDAVCVLAIENIRRTLRARS